MGSGCEEAGIDLGVCVMRHASVPPSRSEVMAVYIPELIPTPMTRALMITVRLRTPSPVLAPQPLELDGARG
jgi:hypothetical protein